VGDGGTRRHRALAADDLGLAATHVVQDQRGIATGAAEMRFDDLQDESRGDGRVEGVAAFLENAHADRRGDPVRRGDDTECADDLRPRGERIGIDESHGVIS
jgi:hypothetical protein